MRFENFNSDELDTLASALYRYLFDLEEGNRHEYDRCAPLVEALAKEVEESL